LVIRLSGYQVLPGEEGRVSAGYRKDQGLVELGPSGETKKPEFVRLF
jgi:hypothetical protein